MFSSARSSLAAGHSKMFSSAPLSLAAAGHSKTFSSARLSLAAKVVSLTRPNPLMELPLLFYFILPLSTFSLCNLQKEREGCEYGRGSKIKKKRRGNSIRGFGWVSDTTSTRTHARAHTHTHTRKSEGLRRTHARAHTHGSQLRATNFNAHARLRCSPRARTRTSKRTRTHSRTQYVNAIEPHGWQCRTRKGSLSSLRA
jgi:hypothetical protein